MFVAFDTFDHPSLEDLSAPANHRHSHSPISSAGHLAPIAVARTRRPLNKCESRTADDGFARG